MNAKCGSCGKKHDTIAEYRDCAGVAEEATAAQLRMDEMTGATSQVNPPSDRQVAYVVDLLTIHEWPDQVTEEDLRAMERGQVSSLISAILSRPLKRQVPDGQPADGRSPRPVFVPGEFMAMHTGSKPVIHHLVRGVGKDGKAHVGKWDQCTECHPVPAGRYALKEGDVWCFYQVDLPVDGKWAGNKFVKMLIGAPGSYRKQLLKGNVAAKVLHDVEVVTPKQASIDYGRETEVCGVCGSDLSNAESIKLGIGPVCIKKMGW